MVTTISPGMSPGTIPRTATTIRTPSMIIRMMRMVTITARSNMIMTHILIPMPSMIIRTTITARRIMTTATRTAMTIPMGRSRKSCA